MNSCGHANVSNISLPMNKFFNSTSWYENKVLYHSNLGEKCLVEVSQKGFNKRN